MISKQYIKQLEFKTIEDIFNYIIESEINGAQKQTKELINKLSNAQFKEFILFCRMHEINTDIFLNFKLNGGF